MKLCPVCSHENSDDAVVCSSCQSEFNMSFRSQETVLGENRPAFFEPDSLISDRYRIVKELGRGGMGVVYLVKDTRLRDRLTALKMIHPELVSHEEARQRFKDEVILSLDLFHPHIVRINNLEEWDRLLYFTMEYIQGQSLRQMMGARKDRHPPFSLEETIQVVTQVLDALSYAHRSIIHRDIKPENILVQGEFPDIQAKVLDFGIAKIMSASRFTRTAQSMGTAYYMAPEQMQGARQIDHRSDIYSAGMIFYEMLTGEVAAGRFKLPGEMLKSLPGAVDNIVDKALAPKPEERHSSAEQMKSELAQCLSQKEPVIPREKPNDPVKETGAEITKVDQIPLENKSVFSEPDRDPEFGSESKPTPEPKSEPETEPKVEVPRKSTEKRLPEGRAALPVKKLVLVLVSVLVVAAVFIVPQFWKTDPVERKPVSRQFKNFLNMDFVWISPGSFSMGSPESEPGRSSEESRHQVTLTRGYYIQSTPVTQGQWKTIMKSNPSRFKQCGDDCPVEQVSWHEAQTFIRKLNARDGKRTYRLPTEAEWEYAARAGSKTAVYTGKLTIKGSFHGPELDAIAWYGGNSCVKYVSGIDCSNWKERPFSCNRCGTHPVGEKQANKWGLYDMLGNVWEWCQDWKGTYPSGSVRNPSGPSSGVERVFRGGSWNSGARRCRAANRSGNTPDTRSYGLGFRLAAQEV